MARQTVTSSVAPRSAGRLPKHQNGAARARPSDEKISAELGLRVKAMRAQSRLTLEQLASRSGVSRAMLSKVERGEKSPTLTIIARIAAGFGVSLSALLGAKLDQADVAVIRASERVSFRDPETGFERWVLSPEHLHNGVEFVLHRIPPGRSSGVLPPYSVPTAKYLSVSEGELTAFVDDVPHVLQTGDSMYFEVKSPYSFVNNDADRTCTYYLTIVRNR